MQKTINGIIELSSGYGVLNFLHPEMPPVPIGTFTFKTYTDAVYALHHRFYPSSYLQYLLAVKNITPTNDTWNNLLFAGHVHGIYDLKNNTFHNVRQYDMNATSDVEVALVEALTSTYQCLIRMSNSCN